jgi:hypothetical protein
LYEVLPILTEDFERPQEICYPYASFDEKIQNTTILSKNGSKFAALIFCVRNRLLRMLPKFFEHLEA